MFPLIDFLSTSVDFVYLDYDSCIGACCPSNTFIDMYFICHFQQYFSYIVAVICHWCCFE